jgi:hypothetical protein
MLPIWPPRHTNQSYWSFLQELLAKGVLAYFVILHTTYLLQTAPNHLYEQEKNLEKQKGTLTWISKLVRLITPDTETYLEN